MSRQIITTKSWKYRAWIAGLVTFAVLLILGIGIVVQAMESGDKVADKTMRDYAKQLKEASSQSLWELVGDGGKERLGIEPRKHRRDNLQKTS